MSAPPAPGLAGRIAEGVASEDDVSWARRRVRTLREDEPTFGLTASELAEVEALEAALGGETS